MITFIVRISKKDEGVRDADTLVSNFSPERSEFAWTDCQLIIIFSPPQMRRQHSKTWNRLRTVQQRHLGVYGLVLQVWHHHRH